MKSGLDPAIIAIIRGDLFALKQQLARRGDTLKVMVDAQGWTLVHYAAMSEPLTLLAWLLEQGFVYDAEDYEGAAPAQVAQRNQLWAHEALLQAWATRAALKLPD